MPGIQFKDVSTLYKNPKCLKTMVNELYELYKDNSKYICVLHLKDVTTNNTINEIIEVFSPEGVKVIKTVSFNNTFLKDEIIKTAFERIYSPELKDSVRIALGEFYDNEDYQRIR